MFCHKCGFELENDAEFCRKCGKPVPREKPVDIVEKSAVWTNFDETSILETYPQKNTITDILKKENITQKSIKQKRQARIKDSELFVCWTDFENGSSAEYYIINDKKEKLTEEFDEIIDFLSVDSWSRVKKNGKYGFLKFSKYGIAKNIPCIFLNACKFEFVKNNIIHVNSKQITNYIISRYAVVSYENNLGVLAEEEKQFIALYTVREKYFPPSQTSLVFFLAIITGLICLGASFSLQNYFNIDIITNFFIGLVIGVCAFLYIFSQRDKGEYGYILEKYKQF